ncbi:PilZ domain-containing protein [Aliiglaciecola sp. LCG003]|uniref:PilZ domain-containing protein n=1 Tax=Aliiglaciecola sp. LCG003 TaxID=3053655 RepID=UPI002572EA33|nr:PilZ domain-containing protein [Aliiglaciecola sp. LCG003]WJG08427.1 PilZ domain-containing protein [Aliiglaciecola sp. LCG003]
MEKRHFNRVLFSASALLIQDHNVWQTTVLDISLKGALIAYPDDFEGDLERDFELDIDIQGVNNNIVMRGTIAHNANHSLGFSAQQLDIESITKLRRLVELNLADDELLHREIQALIAH